jgi:hypothetical protein
MMALTLAVLALGVFPLLGVGTMYISIGVPLSLVNVFLIISLPEEQKEDAYRQWAKLIYLFYGALFVIFTLIFIIIGVIFSFGF